MFADWGYDFLKLDGVGPGSFKSGENYDNVADVAAWQKAIAATGRPIHLEPAKVRDLWNRENLGVYKDKVTQALPAHGSRLFTVTPQGPALRKTAYEAEAGTNTLAGNASVADCGACSGDRKVGNLYLGGRLTMNGVTVEKAGRYVVDISYVSGDARSIRISANGGGATGHKFPSTGDWGTVETVSVPGTRSGRYTSFGAEFATDCGAGRPSPRTAAGGPSPSTGGGSPSGTAEA